ncbi:MAG: alanine:cation symporter family protein [Gammaproteobacteria bacterium]|jgi:AGCS family alanine or glycine:cation symporter|nr:alanine:cation symporter family protein [Gammaproteobacteria bacterium]
MLEIVEQIVGFLNDVFWSYILIILLIGVGLFFSIKTRFAQIVLFKDMLQQLTAKRPADKHRAISSFQAFCVSTASRVGTGNIAGVAIAISLGGPGAIFWMWVIAIIGAGSSLIENTLAQVYKVKDPTGYRGGPAYYMQKGLNARWLGAIFAVLTIFCYGFAFNAVQANTITSAFSTFGADPLMLGLVLALLTGIVIFGGIHRIAHVTQYLVPFFATLYIGVALFIMIKNFAQLPAIFTLIFQSAFGIKEAVGGGMGAAIMYGVRRGLFSNEAGMGSVPNAAATAEVSHPVKQGLVQTFGVFVDTILICSATAFMVLVTDAHIGIGLEGVQIAQAALVSELGPIGNYFITLCVLLFAFSSIISNYYYGETNIEFLNTHASVCFIYRTAVVLFVVLGSVARLVTVWDIADLFMALMALTNLIAIMLLGRIALDVFKDYVEQKKTGKDPVFKASLIRRLKNTDCWD